MKNPIQRLFGATLLLLGCAIALSLAFELIAGIWPWLLGTSLLALAAWIAIHTATARSRKW